MEPRISVIVPVYNPGEYLDPLLRSLDRQTMPVDDFEVIFIDDGSTDGAATRLDEWARSRPNAEVVHQPNHGWPGQPRNVGIERSRGTYVYFVDQDDWLGDEALARLVAYGDANASDVVVGKMKGIGRHVPNDLFKRSVPRAIIGQTPLQDSQTPHKVFRKSFLDEIGLRFPEGKRRLEDHLFVTTAYLRAHVVSVYADYECYIHIVRSDGGNAAYLPFEPAGYYANLEEVLDVIDRYLPAGDVKDRFLQRWIKNELVRRMRIRSVRDMPRARRHAFFAEVSRIMRTRIPKSAIALLPLDFRLGAILECHTTSAQFFRIDRAIEGVLLFGSSVENGIAARLFDGPRRLSADARLSDLLRRHMSPRLAESVVGDFGDDPLLLPHEVQFLPTEGNRVTATRSRNAGIYSSPEKSGAEGKVLAYTPFGRRVGPITTEKDLPIRLRIARQRVGGRVRRTAARAARTVLGPSAVKRLTSALGH